MRLLCFYALGLVVCGACAYPRRTTLLNPLPAGAAQDVGAPDNLYSFRLISADLSARKISGLDWDDDGGPDPFVRLYLDDVLVWESEVIENTHRPEWNAELPRNLVVSPGRTFRLEVWDYDTGLSADPMGKIERRGLPTTALPGARARIALDSKATVEIEVGPPIAQRGVGLTVEVHSDYLKVLQVEPFSPAARSRIAVNEHIVGIGAERVAHMSDDDAISELSLAVDRNHRLTVADAEGNNEREVILDGKLVWLTM